MKTFFLILVVVFMEGTLFAVQPVRKPFVVIKIDGASVKTGDVLTITNGQKLKMDVDLEGGRKDFCKFPETYSDLAGTAKILSKGDNGITYELNGKKAEWKLLNNNISFSGDENIQIQSTTNRSAAELTISNSKFIQTYLKIVIKANWMFSQEGINMHEENVAEGVVYFTTTKSDNVWFLKSNVKAVGSKDKALEEKLYLVQDACDSIEHNMYHLNFQMVQQNIRKLQTSIGELKTTIDSIKSNNPSSKIDITFVGLPSDHPFNDIKHFALIKNSWSTLEPLLKEQKQTIGLLSNEPNNENKKELINNITVYSDWFSKLPVQTSELLNKYAPDIHVDSITVPQQITRFQKDQSNQEYQNVLNGYKIFLDNRISKTTDESQKINNINNRMQAIRLFDGMLRSYFNSISWAEWINTRE